MWCPRTGSPLNRNPDIIQSLKPLVRRRLITNLTPDTLLKIQPGLIAGQVLQMQSPVCLNETVNRFSLMPSRPIYIKPNCITTKSLVQVTQTLQESLPVTVGVAHHAPASKQRRHPPKHIQSLPMLTRCGNTQPFSNLRPPNAKSRMQGKPCFILKDNRLPRLQGLKFFLKSGEIAWPLRCALEDMNTRPVSTDTLTGASTTGPVELSALSQTGALSEPLMWGRPTEPDSAQTPKVAALSELPIPAAPWQLSERDAPASLSGPESLAPARLPCASKDSNSAALSPEPRRSIPDAAPPVSAAKPLSSSPQRLPGLVEPWRANALGWPPDALMLKMGFSWIHVIIISLFVNLFNAFVLVISETRKEKSEI